uniref:Dynactin subunit 1 n=1 Tax=Acrobeloides nanus TaxID=290746 RepID=A0A914E1V4_9BILA
MPFEIGDRVDTDKGKGAVAFYGPTKFADGIWVGVILDEQIGKNNGTVQGEKYFECEPNFGIFIKESQVRLESSTPRSSRLQAPSGLKAPVSVKKSGLQPKGSPAESPKMSPAASMEGLTKVQSASNLRKPSSSDQKSVKTMKSVEVEDPAPSNPQRQAETEVISVKDKAQKIEEKRVSLSSAPVFAPKDPSSEMSELAFLRMENKDLAEKLDILRAKRKEDQSKLEEFKQSQFQIERLQAFKNDMTKAHSELKQQHQALQKEYSEFKLAKSEHDDVEGLMEQLELVALDKEMAEEKAETLQQEVNEQKMKIQELETDLDLLKAEMEGLMSSPTSPSAPNNLQVKQLEQQNERMKEALIKMRDIVARTTIEKDTALKDVESMRQEYDEMQKLYEKMRIQVQQAEETVNHFKEQVDASMGAEKMIDTLTDKNLELEDKIKKCEETIEDLEAMRAMDEEIGETQKEVERELRQELDQACVQINELKLQIKKFDERADEYEKVILKFRQRVIDLNEEIQEHKDQILILKERLEDKEIDDDGVTKTQTPGLALLTQNRMFSEIVESEVRQIELEYAQQHVKYLKAFLPDNFAKPGGDNDFVILNILFPKLAAKAGNLIKLLGQKYPPVPGGMRREHITKSHRAEQWAHVSKFTYTLQSLIGITKKFESSIQQCSVERLSKIAIQQLEMSAQEKHIDQYFELLKQNRLDENTSVENIERASNYFQKIFSVNMSADSFDTNEAMKNTILQFQNGLNWIRVNCQRLKFFIQPPESEDAQNDIAQFVSQISILLTDSEQFSLRANNRIPTEKEITMSSELMDKIFSAITSLEKAAKIMHSTCSFAASQLSMIPETEGLSVQQLKEMLQGSVEKFVGNMEPEKCAEYVKSSLSSVRDFLEELSKKLDDSSMEAPKSETNGFPPLVDRAHARKQDAAEAEGLRWQISKKDNEIIELKRTIKARNDDISSLKVRIGMMDKKIEDSSKSDDARAQHLQEKYDELVKEMQTKQVEYEKSIDSLQAAVETKEKDIEEHKLRLRDIDKKAFMATHMLGPGSIPGTPTSTPFNAFPDLNMSMLMEKEYRETMESLKWAQHRIRQLEAEASKRLLAEMKPLDVPDIISGPLTLKLRERNSDDFELEQMVKESEQLLAESNKYLIEPVDPKQKLFFRNNVVNFNQRVENLKFRFQRFWNRTHPGEAYPRIFTKLTQVETKEKQKTTPENSVDRCKNILEKWKKQNEEDMKRYGHLLKSS